MPTQTHERLASPAGCSQQLWHAPVVVVIVCSGGGGVRLPSGLCSMCLFLCAGVDIVLTSSSYQRYEEDLSKVPAIPTGRFINCM